MYCEDYSLSRNTKPTWPLCSGWYYCVQKLSAEYNSIFRFSFIYDVFPIHFFWNFIKFHQTQQFLLSLQHISTFQCWLNFKQEIQLLYFLFSCGWRKVHSVLLWGRYRALKAPDQRAVIDLNTWTGLILIYLRFVWLNKDQWGLEQKCGSAESSLYLFVQ